MATRKVKRYNTGGAPDSAADTSAADTSEAGMQEAEPAENFKPTSFKDAFAAARSAGGKTFMWQGKKYTTEMAGEKKAAPAAAPAKAAPAAEKVSRVGRAGQATATPFKRYEPTAEGTAAANEKRDRQYKESQEIPLFRAIRAAAGAIRARGESGPPAYAKGGSVKSSASKRADGIAQRGKTKGTMVMCGGGYMKGKK